jgi:hypothetical protein
MAARDKELAVIPSPVLLENRIEPPFAFRAHVTYVPDSTVQVSTWLQRLNKQLRRVLALPNPV